MNHVAHFRTTMISKLIVNQLGTENLIALKAFSLSCVVEYVENAKQK